MYVKILRWRLSEADQTEHGFPAFVERMARRNVLALRKYGLLDGYVVRIAQDAIVSVNFYDSEDNMHLAFQNVTGSPEYAQAVGIEMLDHWEGPAYDLPLSLAEANVI